MSENTHRNSEGDLQEEQGVKVCWVSQRESKRGVIYLTGLLDPERIKALQGPHFISVLPTHALNDKGEPLWVMRARPAPNLAEEQAKSGFGQPIATQMKKASVNPYAAAKAKREAQAPLAGPEQAPEPSKATPEADIPF
jgi:hypothetical protein